MAILKTLLGYYIPTFFEMHVQAVGDEMTISKLSDKEATVAFHEYIHFLQDITTYYGLNNLFVQSEYLHSVVNRVKNQKMFNVPYQIPDNKDYVRLNQQVCKLTAGDNEDADVFSVLSVIDMEEDLSDYGKGIKFSTIVLNVEEDNMRSFGAIAIMESMAYILERLCSPKSYVLSPDFPYRSAELVAQYYDVEFGKDLMKVLALCDVSLQHSNPGWHFVYVMRQIKQGVLSFNTPEEIYDRLYSERVQMHNGKTQYWQDAFKELAEQVKSCLHSYITGIPTLQSYHDWVNHLVDFAKDWRSNDRYFLLKMARMSELKKNDYWGYVVAKVGSPLMVNDNNNHYFKILYVGMSSGESVEMYAGLKEVYDTFMNGQKCCGMHSWCLESPDSTPNKLCLTKPWRKVMEDKLCPYAFFWKHWELTGCEPE